MIGHLQLAQRPAQTLGRAEIEEGNAPSIKTNHYCSTLFRMEAGAGDDLGDILFTVRRQIQRDLRRLLAVQICQFPNVNAQFVSDHAVLASTVARDRIDVAHHAAVYVVGAEAGLACDVVEIALRVPVLDRCSVRARQDDVLPKSGGPTQAWAEFVLRRSLKV